MPAGPDGSTDSTTPEELASRARLLDARSDELDRFSSMASHDLRAPLRSIEAFTRLAIETEDPAELSDHLNRVLNAVGRMRRLLDSLLDLADSGRELLEISESSLEEVANAAVADLAQDVEDSGAVIEIGPLPPVLGDPIQLRRVFTNVFSNAIRYSGNRTPQIEVSAVEEPEHVLVSITDHGTGFPADLADAVFEPFRRLSPEGDGQGIGLAICRRIIEHHGGRVWAESAPGEGTTMRFTLPARDPLID